MGLLCSDTAFSILAFQEYNLNMNASGIALKESTNCRLPEIELDPRLLPAAYISNHNTLLFMQKISL